MPRDQLPLRMSPAETKSFVQNSRPPRRERIPQELRHRFFDESHLSMIVNTGRVKKEDDYSLFYGGGPRRVRKETGPDRKTAGPIRSRDPEAIAEAIVAWGQSEEFRRGPLIWPDEELQVSNNNVEPKVPDRAAEEKPKETNVEQDDEVDPDDMIALLAQHRRKFKWTVPDATFGASRSDE